MVQSVHPVTQRDVIKPFRKLPDGLRPWVKEEMVPFNPKPVQLIAANCYKNAQAAWDAWTVPGDMVCALFKTNVSLGKLALCMCDLVSPAFNVLLSGNVDVRSFRTGIRLAKLLATTETEYLVDPVLDSVCKLTAIFQDIRGPLNIRYAAWAIIRAVRSAIGRRPALDVPFLVERSILASLEPSIVDAPPSRRLLPRTENLRLSTGKIREWQCKRIRKHFPERPVWIMPDVPAENPPLHLFGHLLSNIHLS